MNKCRIIKIDENKYKIQERIIQGDYDYRYYVWKDNSYYETRKILKVLPWFPKRIPYVYKNEDEAKEALKKIGYKFYCPVCKMYVKHVFILSGSDYQNFGTSEICDYCLRSEE